METKDYIYCALIGATAAIFYWHGYLAARYRARKSFGAIFNDHRVVRELPVSGSGEMSPRTVRPGRVRRRSARIRAVFGIN